MTLRTVWTQQPTSCAMGLGERPPALARRIWARRTRKASEARRSASNCVHSSAVNGRTARDGFIAQAYPSCTTWQLLVRHYCDISGLPYPSVPLDDSMHNYFCGNALGG